MTQRERIRLVKDLLDTHDTVETALVILKRAGMNAEELWTYHDKVERSILDLCAMLPQKTVEKLKRGEL